MAGLTPMVEKGAMTFEAAQSIMLAVLRRFRFGTEVEDQFKAMKAPQPKDEGAAQAQADLQKHQSEMQVKQAELQHQGQVEAANNQREQIAEQNRTNEKMAEIQSKERIEEARRIQERENEIMRLEAERRNMQAKNQSDNAAKERQATIDQQTELNKTALQIAGQIEIARISQAATTDENAEQIATETASMDKILAMQQELLNAIVAPVKHERDNTGRILQSIRIIK